MNFKLPIPETWQDFEDICHKLWREIWNDPNTQKNGRHGQSQNGVDVFGKFIRHKKYSGVQCKNKDNNLGKFLKNNEILTECSNAIKFTPELESFIIATTTPRDKNIQEFARQINNNNTFPFSVHIWSWNDIENEIQYRPDIMQKYYSSIILNNINNEIKLNQFSDELHLQAFFSRPEFKEKRNSIMFEDLIKVIYELSDNSYKHGKATFFNMTYKNNVLEIRHDGNLFNPLEKLEPQKVSCESHIGSYVFSYFKNKYKNYLEIKYQIESLDNKKMNLILFEFFEESNYENNNFIEFNIEMLFSRDTGQKYINLINEENTAKEIIINIGKAYNLSGFFGLISELKKIIKKEQTITIYVERDEMLKNISSKIINDSKIIIKYR